MERLEKTYKISKNESKRAKKYNENKETIKAKRKFKRTLKKENHSRKKAEKCNYAIDPIFTEFNAIPIINTIDKKLKIKKSDIKDIFLSNLEKSEFRVCFDLAFNNIMPERKINSLVNQLKICYSLNKSHYQHPAKVHWTSYDSITSSLVEGKHIPLDKWHIETSPLHWRQTFLPEDVIYLSPDAEKALESVECGRVYVIGGLVDHKSEKNLTADIARDLNVKCRRFPIEAYPAATKGGFCVFTVNQTFEILLKVFSGKGWPETFEKVIPKRKIRN